MTNQNVSASVPVQFHKYCALGNDMLLIDPGSWDLALTPGNVQRICDRHFGVGADGICHGPLSESAPYAMRYFNPDGSEAERSGNGLRTFARYLRDCGYVEVDAFEIAMDDKVFPVEFLDRQDGRIRIGMGRARFFSYEIPATGQQRELIDEEITIDKSTIRITCVNVGNPHCVILVDEIELPLVMSMSKRIENHVLFPPRINVQWFKVLSHGEIAIEIWERGAGYTLSSGSSACAAACAAIARGLCRSPVTVRMKGGSAVVVVDKAWNIKLTGRVRAIASGSFSSEFLAELE